MKTREEVEKLKRNWGYLLILIIIAAISLIGAFFNRGN
jgi:hypothetical protein